MKRISKYFDQLFETGLKFFGLLLVGAVLVIGLPFMLLGNLIGAIVGLGGDSGEIPW